ncbi:MAG TPA: hypothetical protein VFI93_08280, partial [Rhizomicrobium sp.]|nr:hypothetical protein [Rhizomicrobium sp.]
EPGDTIKAADAIFSISGTANPPLRLLLGSDAYQYATGKLSAQSAEIEAWEELTKSIDYDESA